MKVYISGIIANGGKLSHDQVIDNCSKFDTAARRLRQLGYEVVNPIELHDPRTPSDNHEYSGWVDYMRKDIAALVTCDAILLLPGSGWGNSRGARLEQHIAQELDLLVVEYDVSTM